MDCKCNDDGMRTARERWGGERTTSFFLSMIRLVYICYRYPGFCHHFAAAVAITIHCIIIEADGMGWEVGRAGTGWAAWIGTELGIDRRGTYSSFYPATWAHLVVVKWSGVTCR